MRCDPEYCASHPVSAALLDSARSAKVASWTAWPAPMIGVPRRRHADAAVNHSVSPQTRRFSAAPLLDASPILFELIGLPRVGWLLPMYSAQSQYVGFDTESANLIAAIKLDRYGLHMTLPAESPWAKSVVTWCDERWSDMWKMGDEAQEYEGGAALAVWQKLSTEYVPRKRGLGQRGVSRNVGASMKRHALDAYMAHVLIRNLKTGAGVFKAAIDQVATDHTDLTKIVWPSRYAYDTDDGADEYDPPHYIRTHIQRESKKAN